MDTRSTDLLGRGKQVLHEEGFLSFLKKVLLFFVSFFVSLMNKVLRKIVEKILLMPKVKRRCDRISLFYYYQVNIGKIKEDFKFYQIVRTVNKECLDIKENFAEGDAKTLEKLVQMVGKEKMMIVEVGSWKGFSTSVSSKVVADYNGKVFAVDHWMGNEGTQNVESAQTSDIFSIFKRNMIALGVWDTVHPLVMDSLTASQIFADGILDLVFIDADHRYEAIKKDISAWLPKLRDGGMLCGHDCEGYYSHYSEEDRKMIEQHLGDDYIRGLGHPGVIKGLYDCFQDDYSIIPNSVTWYYIKRHIASTA